jgi:phenylacetate-CoA ligase
MAFAPEGDEQVDALSGLNFTMIRFPRYWLHRHRYPERYAQLEILLRNQALSREQMLHEQRAAFDDMLAFAAANVPYYSQSLGAHPGVVPILEKDAVRERLPDLLARDADPDQVKLGHTGGSTGKPLAFWYDEAKHELMRAGMMRGFMMSGWRPGQKVLNFWGARQDVAAGGVFGSNWSDLIAAEKTIGATEFSAARLLAWARFIQRYRPVLLYGYASVMSELARFILTEGLRMPDSLIGVYSTAEVLTEARREVMQQAYGCKVFNQYGCREVPNIAWECRHGNMHVFADLVYLESIREGADEQLLVTSLSNRLMPFIRYRLGDSGRLLDGECACGSAFPLMEMGMCRQNDLIRTRAGNSIHPGFFNRLLDGQASIRQFQWIQRELDRIELNLVASEPLSPASHAALSEKIRLKMADEVTLEVNYVEDIPRTVSGKQRFVIGMG